jgi:hypothetical protein
MNVRDMVIISPALGSTVVKSEHPVPGGWATKVTWSDGTVSWHCERDEYGEVKIGPQNLSQG